MTDLETFGMRLRIDRLEREQRANGEALVREEAALEQSRALARLEREAHFREEALKHDRALAKATAEARPRGPSPVNGSRSEVQDALLSLAGGETTHHQDLAGVVHDALGVPMPRGGE